MAAPEGCIFCDIVARSAPARIVYEDERTLAFLDIFPLTRGHTLVVPKRHSTNLLDARTEDVVATALSAQLVARLACERLGADGVNVIQAVGRVAFQTVMHSHVHVLPRYEGDGFVMPFERNQGDAAELDDLAVVLSS